MTQKIGSKGQVVIPKPLRERTGLYPGTEVQFDLEGDRVTLAPRRARRGPGGRFAGSGMAARLVRDHAREPR